MPLYTIQQLREVSGTSEKATRNLFKSNKELKNLAMSHIVRNLNRVFYDEIIYEWFVERYKEKNRLLMENEVGESKKEEDKEANPISNAPPIDEIAALATELGEIKGKFEALQADFEEANKEIERLRNENNLKNEEIQRLFLIIQQEKQEKAQVMLMLPPPKQTIGERIKGLFKKKEVKSNE